MDAHPDAVIPTMVRPNVQSNRTDEPRHDASAAQLRARLLRMIVANEKARQAAKADASKPR
jgi:hypothetical protein